MNARLLKGMAVASAFAIASSYIMVGAHDQGDHPTIRGRTFTFRVYTGPKCIGVPPAKPLRVEVVERPKAADRHFGSVVLTPYVEYPAHTVTVDPAVGVEYGGACARDAMPSVRRRIKLKRPAAGKIFFDGSLSPPRRIWPPPVGARRQLGHRSAP